MDATSETLQLCTFTFVRWGGGAYSDLTQVMLKVKRKITDRSRSFSILNLRNLTDKLVWPGLTLDYDWIKRVLLVGQMDWLEGDCEQI